MSRVLLILFLVSSQPVSACRQFVGLLTAVAAPTLSSVAAAYSHLARRDILAIEFPSSSAAHVERCLMGNTVLFATSAILTLSMPPIASAMKGGPQRPLEAISKVARWMVIPELVTSGVAFGLGIGQPMATNGTNTTDDYKKNLRVSFGTSLGAVVAILWTAAVHLQVVNNYQPRRTALMGPLQSLGSQESLP